jgi:hypothetical protein
MKRLLAGFALAGAALAFTILSTVGSAAPSRDRTFTLIQRNSEEQFSLVDNPPRTLNDNRLTPGDLATLHQPLRKTSGRQVGAADVGCTATRGGTFAHVRFACNGVYSLKRGTLMVEVRFLPNSQPTIAVTGGTGAYEGATGSIRQVSRPHHEVIFVHLIG